MHVIRHKIEQMFKSDNLPTYFNLIFNSKILFSWPIKYIINSFCHNFLEAFYTEIG